MGKQFKDDFEGTGSMKEFVSESNELFAALNNVKVIMPAGYAGADPTLTIDNGSLVLDMGDAFVFSLENVSWNLSATAPAVFDNSSVQVSDGKLIITVSIS